LKLASVSPLPSDRHHLSCDDCLEDKREDYQKCSVLYCVPQLYSFKHIRMSISYRYRPACWVGLPVAGFNPLW